MQVASPDRGARRRQGRRPVSSRPKELVSEALQVDLLRGDLYRILDEMAHASARHHAQLVREFTRAWAAYAEVTAPRT